VQTKRKLLDDCDLWCIVSLPSGVFTAAGAGVKTNLLFFTKGQRTERIWYYDLSDIKVGKKTPFTQEKLAEFFALLTTRADSTRSWSVDRKEIVAKNYDLKAVNPHAPDDTDRRTPEELLDLIDAKGREVEQALAALRGGKF
jgi:type I restriction enzyme M protein